MGTSHTVAVERGTGSRTRIWLGVLLLAIGLCGHLLAARAITPYVSAWIAYRDHVAGFVMLTVVSTIVLMLLGWRFWRGRHDVTLLVVGAIQAAFGIIIYLERFRVIGMH